MTKKLIGALSFIVVLVLPGCGKPQPRKSEAPFVAKVGDVPIAPEEFRRELDRRGGDLTAEKRDAVLRNMIHTEEVLARARAEGFDKDPETVARLKKVVASLYEEKLRGSEARATNSIVELQDYYQKHLSEFVTAERVRAAMIFWQVPKKATEEKRKEFREHAEAIAREAASLPATARGFGDLARSNSEDQASRYVGGDLGLKKEEELAARFGPDLAKKIFSLEPGKLSGLIDGPDGLYLFKGIEHQQRQTKPMAEVKDLVAYRIMRVKQAELEKRIEDKLGAGLNVQINREVLERVAPLSNAVVPPPQAPGR